MRIVWFREKAFENRYRTLHIQSQTMRNSKLKGWQRPVIGPHSHVQSSFLILIGLMLFSLSHQVQRKVFLEV